MHKKTTNILYTLITIIILIGFWNCKQSTNQKVIHITIDEKDITKDFLYSSIVEDVKFIHLETIDTSFNANLWNISKVHFDDNLFFCLDRDVFGGVIIFNDKGKHVYSIKIGQGSGKEIASLADFSIDKERKEIRISDPPYISFYSYKGAFLKREKLRFISDSFEYIDNFSAFTSDEFGLITQKKGEIKEKTYLPAYSIYRRRLLQPFQTLDNGLLFRHALCDTIFLAQKESIIPYRIIDFGKDKITSEELKAIIYDQSTVLNSEKMHNIKYYSETDQFIHLVFQHKNKSLVLLYDKLNAKKIIFPANQVTNDVSFEKHPPLIIGVKDNYFVATLSVKIPAIDTTKYQNNPYLKEFSKIFQGKSLTRGFYNPSIVLIKFKNSKK